SAMDAIISIDTDQRIVLFNQAAEEMFGCDATDALGGPVERFIPVQLQANYAEHLHHFVEAGVTGRSKGSRVTLYGVRANGEEFPTEATISQVEVAGAKLL